MVYKTHGHTKSVKNAKGVTKVIKSLTYQSWSTMNERCYNPRHKWYHLYGGRGIEVCERWRSGTPSAFINFLADMGERPAKEITLDRKDGNLGYYKGNCQWADKVAQAANRRSPQVYVYDVEPANEIPF